METCLAEVTVGAHVRGRGLYGGCAKTEEVPVRRNTSSKSVTYANDAKTRTLALSLLLWNTCGECAVAEAMAEGFRNVRAPYFGLAVR